MCCHGDKIMELIDFYVVPISELKNNNNNLLSLMDDEH